MFHARLALLVLCVQVLTQICPVEAQRHAREFLKSQKVPSAEEAKQQGRNPARPSDPFRIIVRYTPIRSARIAAGPAGQAPTLNDAVKRLGGKVEALFPASQTDTFAQIRGLADKFPLRAQRAVLNGTLPNLSAYQVVAMPGNGIGVEAAIARLKSVPGVTLAYREREYRSSQVDANPVSTLSEVYGIQGIHAPEVWQKGNVGKGITVAVNDSGIYWTHNALSGNIWKNSREIAGNCVDDDKNGFVDDVYGLANSVPGSVTTRTCSLTSNDSTEEIQVNQPMDCDGHGTHVAGTIAARDDGSFGLAGVAPGVRLMALKGLSDQGNGSSAGLARNIVYATDNGADVINNSWGSSYISNPDPALTDAIKYAAAAGVVNVFAAGNDTIDMLTSHPANMDEVIAVGAIDEDNNVASFSNFGSRIDVVAPGVAVNSSFVDSCSKVTFDPKLGNVPVPVSYFTTLSGTSMAAPHVSGAVALILSANPRLTVDEVRAIIRASADDLGQPGFDARYGAGRLNAARAVELAASGMPIPRLMMRNGNVSLYRGQDGRFPPVKISGTALSGVGYEISIKEYSGKGAVVVGRRPSDVRNGELGLIDLSNRPDGRYIIQLSAKTALGTFSSTAAVDLFAKAKVVDSGPVFVFDPSVSFRGDAVAWAVNGYNFKTDTEESNYAFSVLGRGSRRNKTNFKIRSLAGNESDNQEDVYVARFSLLRPPYADRWGFGGIFGVEFLQDSLTGRFLDVGAASILTDDPQNFSSLKVISPEVPDVYTMSSVIASRDKSGEVFPLDRYAVFARDIGLGTWENKIQALKVTPTDGDAKFEVEDLVRSDKNSFLAFPTLINHPTLRGISTLTGIEYVLSANKRQVTRKLVKYDLSESKVAPIKKVLFYEPNSLISYVQSNYLMSCGTKMNDRRQFSIIAVEHSNGSSMEVANGVVGKCLVPLDGFVTYFSLDIDGFIYLNGFDVKTGNRGKTRVSDYIAIDSVSSSNDGAIGWVEDTEQGSRLIELDAIAFRASLNKAQSSPVPKVPEF